MVLTYGDGIKKLLFPISHSFLLFPFSNRPPVSENTLKQEIGRNFLLINPATCPESAHTTCLIVSPPCGCVAAIGVTAISPRVLHPAASASVTYSGGPSRSFPSVGRPPNPSLRHHFSSPLLTFSWVLHYP
ncbi:hypothetical protein KSP40_PGU017793 [Platanthera guangdongensis]|uniref:Uncharacterized protein n=1 Tax=Platanthera guangdongensis TaxID=2320717 RepID=A0ABR2MB33_9ASPA